MVVSRTPVRVGRPVMEDSLIRVVGPRTLNGVGHVVTIVDV